MPNDPNEPINGHSTTNQRRREPSSDLTRRETPDESLLRESDRNMRDSELLRNRGKRHLRSIYRESDRLECEATERLKSRASEIRQWKSNLSAVATAVATEIRSLRTEDRRLQRTLSALAIPRSIAKECLRIRASRFETDLVPDRVEARLTEEVALCAETSDVFSNLRERIQLLITELKSFKVRVESDWSDKTDSLRIDLTNIDLAIDSPLLVWKPGADRFPQGQSTTYDYASFVQRLLIEGETIRRRSVDLRSIVRDTFDSSVEALRDRADRVCVALDRQIRLTETALSALEKQLLRCLRELADVESYLRQLRTSTRKLDSTLKLTQTRLDKRLLRRDVENCRDDAQFALVRLAEATGDGVRSVSSRLERAEELRVELIRARCRLESELMVKRRSLYVDKERARSLRALYPASTTLSGYRE